VPALPDLLVDLYQRACPTFYQLLVFTPLSAILTLIAAGCSVWGRQQYQLAVAYTRKIFHFVIFSMAVGLQVTAGLPGEARIGRSRPDRLYALYYRSDDSRECV
jgi:phytol kinase